MVVGKRIEFDAVENPRFLGQLKAVNVRTEDEIVSDAEVSEEGLGKVPSIDLHGYTLEEAEESTVLFLEEQFTEFEVLQQMPACMEAGAAFVEIVTGRGNHSQGNYCKLRAAICQLVKKMGLKFEYAGASSGQGLNKQGNQGALHVFFPPPKTDRKELRKYQLSKPEILDDLVRRSEERKRDKYDEARAAEPVQQMGLSLPSGKRNNSLEVPSPAEKKSALTKLQQCMSDDFLKKHGLKDVGGNKLAKIKYSDFERIFKDFQAKASKPECTAYLSISIK